MSNKKVLEYLDKLQEVVDKMSDEELRDLILKSGVSPEDAAQYAILEKALLDKSSALWKGNKNEL